MENKEIVRIFSETADLMEIAGEDSFRIRSYRNAIRAIENMTENIEDILADPNRKLTDIPSIGKGMAEHIQEICRTGELTLHKQLRSRYPAVALELLKIEGLGPKGVGLILSRFPVKSLEDVEQLAKDGKLRELPRMGEKLEQKILKSIEAHKRSAGRFHIDVADGLAGELRQYVAACPGVKRVTPAGSLRRGAETIGDIDLLVTGERPNKLPIIS